MQPMAAGLGSGEQTGNNAAHNDEHCADGKNSVLGDDQSFLERYGITLGVVPFDRKNVAEHHQCNAQQDAGA